MNAAENKNDAPTFSSLPPMLRAHGLKLGYAVGPELVCPENEWFAGLNLVQGDEGVGKTALLCTLAGALKPRGGTMDYLWSTNTKLQASDVFWQHPRTELSETERNASCRDWIAQRARAYPQWSAAEFDRHIAGFGMEEHMHKPLLALSTGSLRKLWMAAAWASGAALTLIDEPLAALDRPSERYVQSALNEFTESAQLERSGQATRCVIVTHWDAMDSVDWDDVLTLT